MAEENKTNEAEELASQAAETVEETVDAIETEAAEVTEEVQELDDKVETAVRNVAQEAAEQAEDVADAAAEDAAAVETKVEETVEEEPKKRERRSKQARAEKEAKAVADATKATSKPSLVTLPQCLGASAVCLAIGLLIGKFALGAGGASAAFAGKTTLTEGELDSTVATYTYEGKTYGMTARQLIEGTSSLEAADQGDGNYTIPSAETAVNSARQAIETKEIEKRGIEVTEDEVKEYAKTNLGNDDFEAIGSTYGMTGDKAKELIEENLKVTKLRDEVVGEELPPAPEAPKQAEEGKEDEVKKEYGEYIIKLAGDQWNAEKGEWADKEGSYAKALSSFEISADKGASYTAAQNAYYVAYQEYSAKQTELTSKWADYLNGLLSNGAIQVNTLIAAAQ